MRKAISVTFILSLSWCWAAKADTLVHVGTFEWATEAIVGLSGLEVSSDGFSFYAVGDEGWYLTGEFERDRGQIVHLNLQEYLPILGNDGLPVAARRVGDWADQRITMVSDNKADPQETTQFVEFRLRETQ